MEENKVVETEVEETEEVVEVIDEKKEKRKKIIKRILIGLAGAGAVIGAGALLLKSGENAEDDDIEVIEKNSPFDVAARAEYGGEGDAEVKFVPAGDPRENLWKATPKTEEDSKTETTER